MPCNQTDPLLRDLSTQDVLSAIQVAIELAGRLQGEDRLTAEDTRVLSRAFAAALTVGATSLGECTAEVPYAHIWPVIRRDGGPLVWRCNHDPEHTVSV